MQVYRYDYPAPLGRCVSTGDPHVKTFDGLWYSIYTTGNFIYVRNLSYVPVEVRFTLLSLVRVAIWLYQDSRASAIPWYDLPLQGIILPTVIRHGDTVGILTPWGQLGLGKQKPLGLLG